MAGGRTDSALKPLADSCVETKQERPMQNDRQRAWQWALGVGVGVALFGAGTWRLATFDQTWRAFVRVKIEVVPGSWTNRSFNPFLLEDQIKSASNNFVDPMFRRELESRSGASVDEFHFIKGFQYRSTTIIELEFAGRTEAEVKMLGETAAQLWRERLITNTPPVVSEFIDSNTVTSSQEQWNRFRRWRWRHFGF
jgi:hypothetical protein